jgi:hypothetical protein
MDYTIAFDAPAEKIYQDFTNREYWQTLMDAYRLISPRSEITKFVSGERGTDIVFVQNLPRMYLPPIARTVVPVDMIITRKQHFDPYDHKQNRAKGTYAASMVGSPGSSAVSTSSPRQAQAAGCGSPASVTSGSRSSAVRWRT